MTKFDTFISYSTRDKTAADAACAKLEGIGIRCWIAPRDVVPGKEYAASIIDAIDECQVMVLIFSSNANVSHQIHREIERAASKGIPIVPVRIEEVAPTESMEYFLGGIHWLDALTPPIEKHLQRLVETVQAILNIDNHVARTPKPERNQVEKGTHADREPTAPNRAAVLVRPALAVGAVIASIWVGLWYHRTHESVTGVVSSSAAPQLAQLDLALVPETVPFIPDRNRAAIRSDYLPAPGHKALAISFNRSGFITSQSSDEAARLAAIDSCTRATKATGTNNPCQIYAVGNEVVLSVNPLMPSPQLIRNPAIERPFVGKDLPLVSDPANAEWVKRYAKASKSKALALSPNGNTSYLFGNRSTDEAIRRALEVCGYEAGVPCIILAVDDTFVVPIPATMKVTGFFRVSGNGLIAPEWRDGLVRRLETMPNSWNGIAVGVDGRPGLMLNAPNEQDAISGALTDCDTHDRGCRVIALGPFSVQSDNSTGSANH